MLSRKFTYFLSQIVLLGIATVAQAQAPVPQSVTVSLAAIGAPDNAFFAGNPPKLQIEVGNAGATAWAGQIRLDRFDMLTETTASELLTVQAPARGKTHVEFEPKNLPYGVFRFAASPANGTETVSSPLVIANSPARWAKDLPDDWPLGTHHYNPSTVVNEPMPGFKWYRYFVNWAEVNPRKGEYDWKNLDLTFADIKRIGGKMMIVFEGAPAWTSQRIMQRGDKESRFAPDDMNDYRVFLRALLARYDNDSQVLGALEVWNEYNANMRWQDSWDKLVEMHKVTFEETRKTDGRIQVVGLTISPGHHVEYVENLTERGVFDYVDIVGAHFYEEPYSPNRLNLRNNLPLHMDLLQIPLRRVRKYLPIWDTETGVGWEGINGGPRPGGRMKSQNEMVSELQARPDYNAEQPWLNWAASSERRMAANWVSSTVALMAQGVEKRFSFHPHWYSFDKALNLPWVSNATFGSVLQQVDFRYIMPIGINAITGPEDIGAVAYRIGKPGETQVVVMWAERMTTRHPHPGSWTKWIDPVPVQLPCAPGTEVTVQDLYLRGQKKVKAANYPGGDAVSIEVGEEPVFVWNWKFRDQ